MELDRFRYLLEAYGADFRHWPAAERDAAEQLVATSAEAARDRLAAEQLDRLLIADEGPVSPASVARVLEGIASPPMQRIEAGRAVAATRFGWSWAPTTLLAGMAVLGFLAGIIELEIEMPAGRAADLITAVFNSDPAGALGL